MSRSPETSQNPEYLDPREAAEWFPYTFYFSQGEQTLQHYIFRYLKHRRPNEKPPEDFQRRIRIRSGPETARLALSDEHKPVPKKYILVTISDQLEDWEEVLKDPSNTQIEKSKFIFFLDDILEWMVMRDKKWLLEEEGRPTPGPLNDPWLSHVIHYLMYPERDIDGNPKFKFQGLPLIFQEMLGELRTRLTFLVNHEKRGGFLTTNQKRMLKNLREVVNAYNAHHRDTPASLDDLLKE